jgi:hypothetical protein
MSTQYGTLSHRRTVQVPMWLIVAILVGTVAIGVGYTVERNQGQGAVATSAVEPFPDTQVAAREGTAAAPAAVFPGGLETSGVIPRFDAPAAVFPGALETSGVYPDTQVAAREGTSADTGGPSKPIVINGTVCHQCR